MATYVEIVKSVEDGHNVIITGQAGTGKSFIVNELYQLLVRQGKNVRITATTGIASTMFPDATTLHSFFGLMDGRFQTAQLISKISFDDNAHEIKERIVKTDVLFIDECSMMSCKIMEQVEEICRGVRKSDIVFGGMHIILSGDFLQLRPVPNMAYDDPGQYIFLSDRFTFHRFILQDVHRQTETTLIKAVHELSRGEISSDTESFLMRMKRNLPPGDPPVKLFARNYDVDKFNSDNLIAMDGEVKLYRGEDLGETKQLLKCPVKPIIYLKINAPVMLLVNISAKLVNGLRGTVVCLNEDHVEVNFKSIDNTVKIFPYKFAIYSPEKGMDIATRKQIPITLAFAITSHKAQGLTLPRVEVDCRHMSNPGQVGVAIGRASIVKGLRVLNVKQSIVKKHSDEVYEFYAQPFIPILDDLTCCKKEIQNVTVNEGAEQLSEISEDIIQRGEEQCDEDIDQDIIIQNIEDLGAIDDIDRLFAPWDDNNEPPTHPLPTDINIETILSEIRYDEAVTTEQANLNECIENIKKDMDKFKRFSDSIYDQFFSFFLDAMPKAESAPVENRHTTAFVKKITLFLSNEKYYDQVRTFFGCAVPSKTQYRAAFGIAQKLRSIVIAKAAEPYVEQAWEAARTTTKPLRDSKGSRAKIRYIFGWCIATLRYNKRLLVSRNVFKQKMKSEINKCDNEIRLLDQLEEYSDPQSEKDKDQASLVEIPRKQNIHSGLTTINNKAFHFFVDLDNSIQRLETIENLALHGKSFYVYVNSKVKNDEDINQKWRNLFVDEDDFMAQDHICTIDSLLLDVITKYIKMSSSQFRQDYKRELKVQKEEAHKKQIRMREIKKNVHQQRIDFKAITEDESTSKLRSHLRLCSELVGSKQFLETFTKDHLQRLCAAYEVVINKKMTKKEISDVLSKAIQETDHMRKPGKFTDQEEPETVDAERGESSGLRKVKRKQTIVSGKGKGKRKQKAEDQSSLCGVCKRNCDIDCVCCDLCDTWYHFVCVRMTADEKDLEDDWFCLSCKN